jgi:L-asparaginase
MSKKDNEVSFLMTGGTIDSHYDGSKDTVVPNKHSIIPQYIRSLKLSLTTNFAEICMKDSRNLTKDDLKRLLNAVELSKNKKIVITHGTYTMSDTARYLRANLTRKDQIIILTGSLVPIDGFANSDAPFNLGYTLAKINHLEPGVYVCMNGNIFTAEEVAKMVSEGKFFSIFGEITS